MNLRWIRRTAADAPGQVDVVVYHGDGCCSWRETVATVKDAARELGLGVGIRVVHIRSQQEAEEARFHGSPSVRVNGVDLEGPRFEEQPASYG